MHRHIGKARLFPYVLLLVLLSACGSRIDIPVIRPAANGQALSSIAVQPFSSSNRDVALTLQNRIIAALNREGFVRVSQAGAEAVLKGNLHLGRAQTHCEANHVEDKKGKPRIIHFCSRDARMTVGYQLLHRSGGVSSNQFSESYHGANHGETQAEAMRYLKSDMQIWQEAMNALANKIVADISPVAAKESWTLQEGAHPDLKQALEHFNHKQRAPAVNLWKRIAAQADNPQDRAVAYFNLGALEMSRQDRQSALHNLRAARQLNPAEPLYAEKAAQVENQIVLLGGSVPPSRPVPSVAGQKPPPPPKDVAAPRITVEATEILSESPADTHIKVRVTGKITDDSHIRRIRVNDTPLSLDDADYFYAELTLSTEKPRITITALDAHGNLGRKDITVDFTAGRPQLPEAGGVEMPELAKARYHALVIGIDQYRHLMTLDTAVADAKAVADILDRHYGFKVRLLVNDDATRANIIDTLNTLADTLQPHDQLLVYYGGHGWYDSRTHSYFWQPIEAAKNKRSSWIRADSITDAIKLNQANNILIVADSCYAATLVTRQSRGTVRTQGNQAYLQEVFQRKSRILISSGANQPVSDSGGGNHSVFANAFLRGLREIPFRKFTADKLFAEYIKEKVIGETRDQIPQY